ncbi:MAG: hypothetical protein WA862_01680, partial [Solirubrobacterales bacterium]
MLLGLLLLTPAFPSSASAAECTNTWTGPAEGPWTTAANWSAGHAPTESEVACIGSGKTVNVSSGTNQAGVVQGEGTVRISGGSLQLITVPAEAVSSLATLKMTGGTLSGAGTLNITGSLSWTGASTMAGVGATVVKSGAT